MAPRARAKLAPPDPRLAELEARLGFLEAVVKQTQDRVELLSERGSELERVKQLALEAIAQAQDALSTSSGHDARINHLTLAVAEGIQHVDRAESRIRGVVSRAQRQLRDSNLESPGLEAEAHELRLVDGGPREGEGVPSVPEAVADPPPDPLLERLRMIGLSR